MPGIWDAEPATHWTDAFLAGNGRHGAMVHGDPRDETVIVTHHSLVLPNGTAHQVPPSLAGRLEDVRDLLLAGDSAQALDRFCAGWPEHPPQPFHPAFAIRLRLQARGPAWSYRRELDFRTGLITVSWVDRDGPWRRTCFVSRPGDVVVQRFAVPPDRDLDLTVAHCVALPGAPPGLGVWSQAEASGDSALVRLKVDYPGGGPGDGRAGYAGATRIVAEGGRCLARGGDVRVLGGRDVLLATRVAGRHGQPEDSLAALAAGYEQLRGEHAAIHRAASGRVRLDLGASPADRELPVGELLARQAARPDAPLPALLEKLFDAGRYLLMSSSGLLPPRLTGLWQGDWAPAWSGCLSINANLGLQLAGAVTADVPEAVHALASLVTAQLADWRVNARRLYGARGILAPAQADGTDGLCRHFAPGYPHQMWISGADWLLVPLIEYADATGDDEFLRRQVQPALTELARFYEDFLRRTDDRGRVVFVPSYSPENQPGGWTTAAVNATMDIAAARHALTEACARIAPAALVSRWRALLARLPPYRVNGDGALAEWAWPPEGPVLPDSYEHRHISHLYPVWPLHEITVRDTPELAAAAVRALHLRGAQDGSAHGHAHQALAAARLREAGLAGRELAALTGGGFFFRSLMSSHYPGRRVYNADATCALPGLLAEMLADSVPPRAGRPGRLELLPAVPAFLAAGRLSGARTRTQVRLDLAWDLGAGWVQADMRSRVAQPVELCCRVAGPAGSDGRTGQPWRLSGGIPARPLRPGARRVELPADRAVRVELTAE